MKFSDKTLSQTLVQLCLAKGIEHIVISPGSRNAPLTIGFASHPGFTCFSIVDERSAAFFALGIAQQLKKPVAIVCSSGSALLNYYPAISEAFYSNIQLLVFSADRPEKFIDIGDGQTIRQKNIYDKHILYSANCSEGETHQLENEKEINIALNTAIELSGPVHINIPFSEPLYQTVEFPSVRPQNVEPRKNYGIQKEELSSFLNIWNSDEKKMILVGVLSPDSIEQQWIEKLAQDKSILVLTETTSNLHHQDFIPAIDQLIASLDEKGFSELQPDILLTFGGLVVSKKIKAFLRDFPPKHHWHVDRKIAYDTFFVLEHHFKQDINDFFTEFLPQTEKISSSYQTKWLEVKKHRLERQKKYESEIPYSDFMVFQKLFEHLPKNIQLQISNSAAIRYAQLFDIHSSVQVFCNRGTSGIDGSTSTAVGAAYASDLPTVLITGDLSFFYDSNGLWNNYIPENFKIIVVNNQGGGIFRILSDKKDSKLFDTYFETKHHLNTESISEMYGFNYFSIKEKKHLDLEIKSFYDKTDGRSILEIFTPAQINDRILMDYFKYIS